MKVLVAALVFSCIAAAISAAEEDPKYKEAGDHCIKETGIGEDAWKNADDGKLDDPKMPEFLFCVFKKLDFLDDKGEYQLETIKESITTKFTEEVGDKYIKECTKETFEDGLKTSMHLAECYHKTVPKTAA